MDVIERISAIMKMASGIEDHEVYDKLGDLRIAAYELKTELSELKEENRILKDKLADAGDKKTENQCYYFNDEGPFCTRCYDVDAKKVLMHEIDDSYGTVKAVCTNCTTTVVLRTYKAKSFPVHPPMISGIPKNKGY